MNLLRVKMTEDVSNSNKDYVPSYYPQTSGSVGDFFALLKPRVMSLVIFTALVGIILAPQDTDPFLAFISILCIALGAGASGALNMWYEADIDAVMKRTENRPIPKGLVERRQALAFGLILSFFSVYVLGFLINWVAAGLLAFTIFFYAVVYTVWLKPNTPQNIVIGGAAGALPPVVGWASVTADVSLFPIILFAIIFMWTPPHFWALALFKQTDYGRANIPMMPNVRGEASTRKQIFYYALSLLPLSLMPTLLGYSGVVYGLVATVLSLLFIKYAYAVLKENEASNNQAAKGLFKYSLFYLAIIFLFLVLDHLFFQESVDPLVWSFF